MADIFISYKREDFERVLPIVRALEERGYSVWWDRKLVAGQEWERLINEELRAASCIVVIWTRRSVDESGAYSSDRVYAEADAARNRNVLVPVLLDADRIPEHHKRVQFAALIGWAGKAIHPGFHSLVAGIERFVHAPAPPADDEIRAWREAEAANTVEALRQFARAFPHSRFISVANGRIGELEWSTIASSFFIEDDDTLQHIYEKERLLTYPLPHSLRKIGYVAFSNLQGERAGNLTVRALPAPWVLSERVKLFTEASFREWMRFSERANFYEGRNARCAGLKPGGGLFGGSGSLTVQRTSYEDYLRTNIIIDHRFSGRRSLRELLHPAGALDRFETSLLANTIGINVLLVNPGGDVPLQVRSKGVAIRPGQVCSSASGTFEVADVPNDRARLSQCHLMREAGEELGVDLLDTCTAPPVIVGLARELARGGQLEIFVVVEANFSRRDVEDAAARARDKDEWLEFDYLQLDRRAGACSGTQIERAVDDLERRHPGRISSPLRAHLSLWFGYLSAHGLLK